MIRKFLPLIAILVVIAGGLFGGEMLRGDEADPSAEASGTEGEAHGKEAAADPKTVHKAGEKGASGGEKAQMSYFRFPSQFFVPVMHGDRLDGMMVLTLTIEMPLETEEAVFKQEFRLRDAFLRTLLIHANTGGFDGNFTIEPRMRRLREALMDAASEYSGGLVTDVLIEDIARQDAV